MKFINKDVLALDISSSNRRIDRNKIKEFRDSKRSNQKENNKDNKLFLATIVVTRKLLPSWIVILLHASIRSRSVKNVRISFQLILCHSTKKFVLSNLPEDNEDSKNNNNKKDFLQDFNLVQDHNKLTQIKCLQDIAIHFSFSI